jgi:hypothetical protein
VNGVVAEVSAAIDSWFDLSKLLGLSQSQIFDLYHQKWVINLQRVLRGRSQIGDVLAESENKSIEV